MATSGTYTSGLTANEVILEALENIQAVGDGETLTGDHFTRAARSLNGLLKEWQTQGIHLWTMTEGTLFLKVGQAKYDFRDATTHVANTHLETTTTADTLALALSLVVTNTDNMSVGDNIGIMQNDNDLFWTTISSISGLTVVVASAITLPSLVGAQVRTYTDNLIPVARVSDVRRREGTDYEIPIVFESRKDYFNLPNKEQLGTPIQAYYDRQDIAGETSGVMYLWNAPISSVPTINFTYERKIQVVESSTDTIDLPDYAQEALIYNLSKRLIPKFGCGQVLAAYVIAQAQQYKDDMLAFDNAMYPITIDMSRYR